MFSYRIITLNRKTGEIMPEFCYDAFPNEEELIIGNHFDVVNNGIKYTISAFIEVIANVGTHIGLPTLICAVD